MFALRTLPLPACLALLVLLWTGGSAPLHAQSSDTRSVQAPSLSQDSLLIRAKSILNEGVNSGSVDSLRKARALFKRATTDSTHRALAHYYAALADYRLSTLFPDDAEDRREQVLNDATEHLQTATELDDEFADAWALLTGVYGQRMGLNPMQAMSLSSDADAALKRAKELAPDNPRVWIIDGTQDFFTPSMFGGDKERALKKFQKAARLAERETVGDPLRPSWGHAEAYAWIGNAHLEAGRMKQAREAFETALDINPDYGWVRESLLPQLEKEAE